ncbi:MAG: AzlD domain-containing protein [Caldilineales bacterium]|nr:AzlD domain-containing protein [Caldilineales bacterium]
MTADFLTILGMGLVTYAIRLLPIQAFTRIKLPVWAYQAMRYIPAAVLTAIIVPELLFANNELALSPLNGRLIAGVIASVVAWRTRNVVLTVFVGMVIVWLFQAIV